MYFSSNISKKGNAYLDGRATLHLSVSLVNVACKPWGACAPSDFFLIFKFLYKDYDDQFSLRTHSSLRFNACFFNFYFLTI